MSIRNETREAMKNWGRDFSAAKARGVWPSPGTHICKVIGITVGNLPFRWRVPNPDDRTDTIERGEVEGISFQFSYQLVDDPNNPENPMQFDGKIIVCPVDASSVPERAEGSIKKGARAVEDIKSAIVTLLDGTVPEDPIQGIEHIQEMISKGEVIAKVTVKHDEQWGNEERIVALVSSPDS